MSMGIDSIRPSFSTNTSKEWETTRVSGEYAELKEKSKYSVLSVSEEALLQAVEKANKALMGSTHEFRYKVRDNGEIIVSVLNKDTQEIIREVPSEKLIELVEKLQELTIGAIIDEKR